MSVFGARPAGVPLRLPRRIPRLLHPGAWWLWALGLGTAASRTWNPLLLGLIAAVAGYVVAARRTDAPWARSYAVFLRLALAVVALRVLLAAVFGMPVPGRTLLHLPSVPLPGWLAGARLGGDLSVEGLAAAGYDGLRIGVLLSAVGAANALASPYRLLKALPGALYEAGVALTVALTVAPQAVAAVGRVRAARRLRGRPDRGLRGLRGCAVPVLEGALERAVALAAAMDARGFGRRAGTAGRHRLVAAACTLGGLLAVAVSLYGLLDATSPGVLGLPLLAGGVVAAGTGLWLGGRRTPRTRYRPDPWTAAEWAVAASGALAAAATVAFPAGLAPAAAPLDAPSLPLLPAAAVLLALAPAWLAPPPPRPGGGSAYGAGS